MLGRHSGRESVRCKESVTPAKDDWALGSTEHSSRQHNEASGTQPNRHTHRLTDRQMKKININLEKARQTERDEL